MNCCCFTVVSVDWVGSFVGWADDFSDAHVDWDTSFELSDGSEFWGIDHVF